MMLARSGARALAGKASGTPLAAFYGTGDDRSMGENARDAAGAAAGTDSSNPSIIEKMREGMGKMTEKVGEMFKEDGSVGRQFTPEGAAGGTAQEVGGPFDKEGSVGKQFTTEGVIGGKVQQAAEAVDKSGEQMQQKAQQNQGKEQARKEV